MKNIFNISIYYPQGIFACKNLREYICFHLLEHLVIRKLSKIFNLNPFSNIRGGINFDYWVTNFRIENKNNLDKLIDDFDNFTKIFLKIDKQDFFSEKKRIKEEEYLDRKNWLRKLENNIFSKIFDNKIIAYKSSEYLKILEKLNLTEVIDFAFSFINPTYFFMFVFHSNRLKIIKQIDKNFIFEERQLKNFKNNQIIIRSKSLPYYFVILNHFKNSFENIFFYDFLINQKSLFNFFQKIIINEGLAYNYYFNKIFGVFSQVLAVTIISTTNLLKVKKEYGEFFNKNFIKKLIKNFEKNKDEEIRKSNKDFYRKFKPAIINYYLTCRKLPSKEKIIQKLSKTNKQNFENFLDYLGIIFIEQK